TLAAIKFPRLSLGFPARAFSKTLFSASGVVFNCAAIPRKLLRFAAFCRSARELSTAAAPVRACIMRAGDCAVAVADAASMASAVSAVPAYQASGVTLMGLLLPHRNGERLRQRGRDRRPRGHHHVAARPMDRCCRPRGGAHRTTDHGALRVSADDTPGDR